MNRGCVVGVSDHGGWAVFVTATRDGTLLDRRRVELVDDDLPAIPHHHEAQMLPTDEGVALVERVRASAEKNAARSLEALARDVPQIHRIALRSCPPLPTTVAACISDVRARNVADWVMYRKVLASAAQARGWNVYWFDKKKALEVAKTLPKHGTPWSADYRLAAAGAILAEI